VPIGSRTNSIGIPDGTIVTSESSSGRIGCAGSAVDVDRVVVDHVECEGGLAEVARRLASELVAHRPLERVLDVVGVEGRSIREDHTLAQVEPPGAVALVLPRLREARHYALVALHVELGQRLVDVLHDYAADVRPRCHAGLDQVDVLAEHDGDGLALLGEGRRE
jgi:hypothetical protein